MSRVLIVDDSEDSRESFAKLIEAAGHTVACAANGRDALFEIIGPHLPDVVLLDLLLPEMDGPSLLEVVRSYLRIQSLPVVVLTAMGDTPMIDHVQALKVNSILVKGKASPEDILKAIEEALVRLPG